jgi:hypothetical protein
MMGASIAPLERVVRAPLISYSRCRSCSSRFEIVQAGSRKRTTSRRSCSRLRERGNHRATRRRAPRRGHVRRVSTDRGRERLRRAACAASWPRAHSSSGRGHAARSSVLQLERFRIVQSGYFLIRLAALLARACLRKRRLTSSPASALALMETAGPGARGRGRDARHGRPPDRLVGVGTAFALWESPPGNSGLSPRNHVPAPPGTARQRPPCAPALRADGRADQSPLARRGPAARRARALAPTGRAMPPRCSRRAARADERLGGRERRDAVPHRLSANEARDFEDATWSSA